MCTSHITATICTHVTYVDWVTLVTQCVGRRKRKIETVFSHVWDFSAIVSIHASETRGRVVYMYPDTLPIYTTVEKNRKSAHKISYDMTIRSALIDSDCWQLS